MKKTPTIGARPTAESASDENLPQITMDYKGYAICLCKKPFYAGDTGTFKCSHCGRTCMVLKPPSPQM